MTASTFFSLENETNVFLLRLESDDGTNRLTRECVIALEASLRKISAQGRPLVITGNENFFSAGAELTEIAALDGPSAYEFSKMGQALMLAVEQFPAPVYAAISGYCMGGGGWISLLHAISGLPRPMPCLDIAGRPWDSLPAGAARSACRVWLGKALCSKCLRRQKRSARFVLWRSAWWRGW